MYKKAAKLLLQIYRSPDHKMPRLAAAGSEPGEKLTFETLKVGRPDMYYLYGEGYITDTLNGNSPQRANLSDKNRHIGEEIYVTSTGKEMAETLIDRNRENALNWVRYGITTLVALASLVVSLQGCFSTQPKDSPPVHSKDASSQASAFADDLELSKCRAPDFQART